MHDNSYFSQIVSIVMAGAAIGSLIGGPLADAWGRRRSILASAVLFIAGAAAMAAAPVFPLLLLGRFTVGAAVGASGMVVSVYLSELSSPYWRGMVVATNELAVCAGCLLALALSVVAGDAGFHWRWLLGLSAAPAVVQLLGSPWLPQSPVWSTRQVLRAMPAEAVTALLQRGTGLGEGEGGSPTSDAVLQSEQAAGAADAQDKSSSESASLTRAAAAAMPAVLQWAQLSPSDKAMLGPARRTLVQLRGSAEAADAELLRIIEQHMMQSAGHRRGANYSSGDSSEGSEGVGGSESSSTGLLAPSRHHARDSHSEPTKSASSGVFSLSAVATSEEAAQPTSSIPRSAGRASGPFACQESLNQLAAACRRKASRHALGLAVSSAIVQNMAFSNALLYYAKAIFDAAGLQNHLLPSLGVGTAKLLGVAAAIPLLPRVPRRGLLAAGMLGQIVACLAMAIAFATLQRGSAALQAIVLTGMLLFIFAWDISWAPGLWVVCSELLPGDIRGTGMGLAVAAFWASSATSNQVVLTISDSVGWEGFMAVVCGLTVFALCFVLVALPETQGRPLSAIQGAIAKRSRGKTCGYLLCPLLFWPEGSCAT